MYACVFQDCEKPTRHLQILLVRTWLVVACVRQVVFTLSYFISQEPKALPYVVHITMTRMLHLLYDDSVKTAYS